MSKLDDRFTQINMARVLEALFKELELPLDDDAVIEGDDCALVVRILATMASVFGHQSNIPSNEVLALMLEGAYQGSPEGQEAVEGDYRSSVH